MKKLIIIFAIFIASCTKENPCQAIRATGFNAQIGSYVQLEDGTKVAVTDWRTYKIGDAYCQ